ncbi:MAG: hypothetical protein ACC657_05135 [Thiohalomonadales bacterium]
MKKLFTLLTLIGLISISTSIFAKGYVSLCNYTPCWSFTIAYDTLPPDSNSHDYKIDVGSDDSGHEYITIWATIDKDGSIEAWNNAHNISSAGPYSLVCTVTKPVNGNGYFQTMKNDALAFKSGQKLVALIDYSNPSACRYFYMIK